MKNLNESGGSAFPATETHEYFGDHAHTGMSLRDWFAGQALAGIMANPVLTENLGKTYAGAFADEAYAQADAMLAARKE